MKYKKSQKSFHWEQSCYLRIDVQIDRMAYRHIETNSHFSQFCEGAWKLSKFICLIYRRCYYRATISSNSYVTKLRNFTLPYACLSEYYLHFLYLMYHIRVCDMIKVNSLFFYEYISRNLFPF